MGSTDRETASAPPPPRPSGLLGRLVAGSVLMLVGIWLAQALGGSEALRLPAQGLAVVVFAASALAGIRALVQPPRASTLWLLGLVALSLGGRLAGIDHEIEQRAYLDEGTYYHHAEEINAGQLLTPTFVYPHLLYYLDAFVLWLVGLFPGLWGWFARVLWSVEEPLAVSWLALRATTALLSALVVIPVVYLGSLLGSALKSPTGAGTFEPGRLAGVLAGLLVIASPTFNDGSHVNISDVPSAVFATFSLSFCGRLLLREGFKDYALAGLFAGLAAATKYPAGVVAVAIVAPWFRTRLMSRRVTSPRSEPPPGGKASGWKGLLLAGGTALGVFVLTMPSLLVFPRQALFGGRGLFFGVRQYAGGGWLGVMPGSNTGYYLTRLWEAFGPALVLGLLGLALALGHRRARGRLLWLLPFPAAYFLLIGSMNMVVKRNLFPVLPAMAALLGFGIVAVATAVGGRFRRPARVGVTVVATVLALVIPVAGTGSQTLGLLRQSTREQALTWMIETLPPGVAVLGEAYTPTLPPEHFAADRRRFAGRFPLEELRSPERDFLLLSGNAYGRFLRVEDGRREHHDLWAERYRTILDSWPQVRAFEPGPGRLGPHLALYRVPLPESCPQERTFLAADLFVPDGSMRPKNAKGPVRFTRPGQWALAKGCLAPGVYSVRLEGSFLAGSRLAAQTLEGAELDLEPIAAAFTGGSGARLRLDGRAKVLFYLYLAEGSTLDAVQITSNAAP